METVQQQVERQVPETVMIQVPQTTTEMVATQVPRMIPQETVEMVPQTTTEMVATQVPRTIAQEVETYTETFTRPGRTYETYGAPQQVVVGVEETIAAPVATTYAPNNVLCSSNSHHLRGPNDL